MDLGCLGAGAQNMYLKKGYSMYVRAQDIVIYCISSEERAHFTTFSDGRAPKRGPVLWSTFSHMVSGTWVD